MIISVEILVICSATLSDVILRENLVNGFAFFELEIKIQFSNKLKRIIHVDLRKIPLYMKLEYIR